MALKGVTTLHQQMADICGFSLSSISIQRTTREGESTPRWGPGSGFAGGGIGNFTQNSLLRGLSVDKVPHQALTDSTSSGKSQTLLTFWHQRRSGAIGFSTPANLVTQDEDVERGQPDHDGFLKVPSADLLLHFSVPPMATFASADIWAVTDYSKW